MRAAGRPHTTIRLRKHQLNHVRRCCGDLADLDPHKLLVWFGEQCWAPETRRSYRVTLVGFYRWCGMSTADVLPPVVQVQGIPRPAPDDVWLEALSRADDRVRLMLRLAAEARLRRGEIAGLHTRDLLTGDDGSALLVRGKGRKQRAVPIHGHLAAQLASLPSGWVFPSDKHSGHLSPEWVGVLCSQALPEQWTLHTLRHRFASRAYRGSRNLRAVQELLGHTSVKTTERYTAVDGSELRETMQAAL